MEKDELFTYKVGIERSRGSRRRTKAEEKGGWSRREGWLKPKDVGEKDELEGGGVGVVRNLSIEKKVVVGGKKLGVERNGDRRNMVGEEKTKIGRLWAECGHPRSASGCL